MAREAIELHLEGLIEDGQPVPQPSSIERHKRNSDYKGGVWAVATADPARLRLSAKRVNVTIPERVLDAVDRFADEQGETRSGLLVRAVTEYMTRQRRPHSATSHTERAKIRRGPRAKA
jgi:hypothetical protein